MKNKLNQPDVETTTTNSLIDQQEIVDFKRNNTELYPYKYGEIKIEPNVITYNSKIYVAIDSLNPTLEQVKKEWEDLGYEWEEREYIIFLCNRKIEKTISINTIIKGYSSYDFDGQSLIITLQEHQLLTKIFKALGWYDE